MMAQSVYRTHSRRNMWHQSAATLLAITMMTTFSWSQPAWGEEKVARVGVLSFSEVADDPNLRASVKIFRRILADRGWIEGERLALEFRSAHSDPSQLAKAAVALVELKVDVIVADSAPALRAAYAATRSIAIVASDYTTDPIAEGYVHSYARPGGNVTGIFLDAPEFAGKWFELLQALVPGLSRVAVVWDPAPGDNHLRAVRTVAKSLGIKLQVLEAHTPDDLAQAFDALRGRPQAVIILPSPMTYGEYTRLAGLALRNRLPAASMTLEFANAGGAIAYGPDGNMTDVRIAEIVAKILGGSKPADLPVERPVKIQLVVNLKTAKALDLTVPQSILLRADEVIR
jgi:putative ABC transport system substrate-binding protein